MLYLMIFNDFTVSTCGWINDDFQLKVINISITFPKLKSLIVTVLCLTYSEGLLEGSGLILSVFGNGGVTPGAFTSPHLLGARLVPVLVGGLRELRPDLHQVLGVGLHQRLSGEESQVQFERSGQSSDDSDRVGGVCAELVQRREESVPLVFQLKARKRSGLYSKTYSDHVIM